MLGKSRWWSAVLGLFLALGMLVLAAPPARVAGPLGTAVKISGESWVKHTSAPDWQKLITGADILTGDLVQVVSGDAEILMNRGDRLRLTAGTKMTFSKASLLRLTVGEAWFRIQSRLHGEGFSVETPAGVVGVRGTVFSVSVAPSGETLIRVVNGKVSAEDRQVHVLVGPWESAILHPENEKTPPTLKEYDNGVWPELEAWSEEQSHEEAGEDKHGENGTVEDEDEGHDAGAGHDVESGAHDDSISGPGGKNN